MIQGPPILTTASSLWPSTREAIRARRLQRRVPKAIRLEEPVTLELIPFVPKTGEDLDALLRIWTTAAGNGEHHRVFGDVALSPSGFVTHYTQNSDMVIVAQQGANWRHGDGQIGLAWIDDTIPGARARFSYWVHPTYRTLKIIIGGMSLVLEYLFLVRGFLLLYGLTPATHPAGLRMARLFGFREVCRWPLGCKDGPTVVDGVMTMLTKEDWTLRQQT